MTIWLSAGEPSGDRWGAGLASALLKRDPGLCFVGMGGPRMRAAGVQAYDPPGDGIMGFAEPLHSFRQIIGRYRRAVRTLERERPSVAVVIDYPEFHLRLLKRAKAVGTRTVYVIPPQVWAWRPKRARLVASRCDRVVTAFDWEREWYARWMPEDHVLWCGHPLADAIAEVKSPQVRGLSHVALLPGSRRAEIERLAPVMAQAARQVGGPAAFAADRQQAASWMQAAVGHVGDVNFSFAVGQTMEVLREARVAAVCAGTATLEAAALGVPMVIVYRTDWLTYQIARRLVRTPWIGLPNILLREPAYPELVQENLSAKSLATALNRVIDVPPAHWRAIGESVRAHLGEPGVFDRIASVILSLATGA